jgi:hypothetical protein
VGLARRPGPTRQFAPPSGDSRAPNTTAAEALACDLRVDRRRRGCVRSAARSRL